MEQTHKREQWVDYVKLFACILVVLGHFAQSMTLAQLADESRFYLWFNDTIYLFHVPLFFICSGYLYAKYSTVRDFKSYKNNIAKKALDLGVPYFSFSLITWVMKSLAASSVNLPVDSLAKSLFINPIAPYWFLLSLFLMFLITPTVSNKKEGTLLIIITIVFRLSLIFISGKIPTFLAQLLNNYIWFALGMCFALIKTEALFNSVKAFSFSIAGISLFIAGTILIQHFDLNSNALDFILGLIMCCAVIVFIGFLCRKNKKIKILDFSAKYTMPIFLMHTIFAAAVRILLLKLSVTNIGLHILFGLTAGFAGPIIAAVIMNKTKYLEFFIYPRRVIKAIKEK